MNDKYDVRRIKAAYEKLTGNRLNEAFGPEHSGAPGSQWYSKIKGEKAYLNTSGGKADEDSLYDFAKKVVEIEGKGDKVENFYHKLTEPVQDFSKRRSPRLLEKKAVKAAGVFAIVVALYFFIFPNPGIFTGLSVLSGLGGSTLSGVFTLFVVSVLVIFAIWKFKKK